jgi:hypothetical protein
MLENKVLRKLFRHKNYEVGNLVHYIKSNIVSIVKPRRL